MRKVSLDKIELGFKLAQAIFGPKGQMLLSKGTELTETFVQRLKDLGYVSIYVDDGLIDDSLPDEIISSKTRMQVANSIKEVTEHFKLNKGIKLSHFKKVMSDILNDVISNRSVLASLTDIRTADSDDHLFNHAINVTAISVLIGIHLFYSNEKLHDLGMGVLLHDLGKATLPPFITTKPMEQLTQGEFELYEKHTWNGFEILRSVAEIKITSAHVALQHHEKVDGSGFPRGLKGNNILEFARIAAIADTYDNLSNDWGTRKKLPAHKVYDYLQSRSGTYFDSNILDRFIQKIALYPQGTKVLMNNGKSGFVIRQNSLDNMRPIVRLFWNTENDLTVPEEIDLLADKSLSIVEVLE